MQTIGEIVNELMSKTHENSCLNCSELRIQNGKIWCQFGIIEPFDVLDGRSLIKHRKYIIRRNNCEMNDAWVYAKELANE